MTNEIQVELSTAVVDKMFNRYPKLKTIICA